jgi:hypothetical protein
MDFIKKNWEKVLLGVVLVGLTVAVALLPLKVASEREALKTKRPGLEFSGGSFGPGRFTRQIGFHDRSSPVQSGALAEDDRQSPP